MEINNSNPTNPKMSTDSKQKVVVIMGATGSGKSRLAIDLASHFPIEIINADSMQVYEGLDIITNKVPIHHQKGVPHHLLGTISPMVEFTAKDFRDYAIPLIDDITSRNHLPVIVGGTNYYIQALVSRFLLDDSLADTDESCLDEAYDKQPHTQLMSEQENFSYSYESLKDLDPVAANRIHPNDHRKISQYLHLYASSGILPSKYLQEKTMENWGKADNLRYNCCFICVDASLPIIDKFVDQRVDEMVDSGLLLEVYDIFHPDADYTRGLKQAIGVKEFEDFLKAYLSKRDSGSQDRIENLIEDMKVILSTSDENPLKQLLKDAVDKVKLNTRRLVRRQKRRLIRLQTLFGWNIHYVDATECLSCFSEEMWTTKVVEPSIQIIKSYFDKDVSFEATNGTKGLTLIERDLWTQHICKACGNKVLRGAYEWEQHKQGRSHRKRVCKLRKSGVYGLDEIQSW